MSIIEQRQVRRESTCLIETEISAPEGTRPRDGLIGCTFSGRLLARLVQMPPLAVLLPFDQGINFSDGKIYSDSAA
jgi:hypothetical protein